MKNIIIAMILLVTGSSCSQKPENGYELIEQMYKANKSNWYETLCFTQEVLHYWNDSITSSEVWYEAYQSPGNLIIRFNDWNSGNGMLFTNDTIYSFREDTLESVRYRIHDLVVLGLDINNIPPEITAERAVKCGYNLDLLAEGKCMGRDAWIAGDTLSTCFWADMESLLFLKMRRRSGANSREVEFARYEDINGFPVATEIRFYDKDGVLNMVEKYFNVMPGCRVPAQTFIPSEFNNARW
ncbi:MAG: hypothetical protein KBB24_08780 [Bacteroidales bacterium]|jgi:hypothetical protein|nr:hypothetical protein [Bacteroidales bacterium]MDX9726834.1 hypothetical protein [Bacteroidales bacterium]HNX84904.1 hypothetical protein [Bacteroidales bacterium]HOC48727.1 hypothetical protein [Bacteroidales bacterium]